MTIVFIGLLIFALTLGAGFLGIWVNRTLPAELQSDSARAVVGQVAGLVSLLLALVLGTLIGTSFAFFGGQKTAIETLSSQVLMLDQALAQYGPETMPAREKLKASVQGAYETFWGEGEHDPKLLLVSIPLASALATKTFLSSLKPETDVQKQAVAAANAFTNQIEQGRVLMDLQVASHPVNPGLVIVLVVWAVILFFGMGLFAQSNGLVVSALTFGALCVAFAVFLILELGLPYTGMFRVPGAALHEALVNIAK